MNGGRRLGASTVPAASSSPDEVAPFPGLRHLWALVPLVAAIARAGAPIRDNSFLWHVTAGTLQLELGEVLRHDPFSFTYAGRPWRTQSWLLELGYGWAEGLSPGLGWVRVMLALAGVLTVALAGVATWRIAMERGRDRMLPVVVAMGIVAWSGMLFFVPRPVLWTFPLILLVSIAAREPERLAWALVPLIWVWAAIHGGFVLGLGLIVLHALRSRSTRLAAAAALASVASLLTAHGVGTWETVWRFAQSREALAFIEEWARTDLFDPFLVPYAVVVALAVFGVASRRMPVRELWVLVPFAVFGFVAERNVFPALLVLVPPVLGTLASAAPLAPARPSARLANAVIACVVLVGAAASLGARPARLASDTFPAAEVLAALPPGRAFHSVAVGGQLIYLQWPQRQVYVDDRAELYGVEGFSEYVRTRDAVGWRDTFDRWGITAALVERTWPLHGALVSAGWLEIAGDTDHAVLAPPG